MESLKSQKYIQHVRHLCCKLCCTLTSTNYFCGSLCFYLNLPVRPDQQQEFWSWDDLELSLAGPPACVRSRPCRAPPRFFSHELLGGVRLGFLVLSSTTIACELLQLLGAQAKARPGKAWCLTTFNLPRHAGSTCINHAYIISQD
jgi:hypothetical protein